MPRRAFRLCYGHPELVGETSLAEGGLSLMDWSRLSSHDKLAVSGAVASIVGPVLGSMGFGYGIGWIMLLLAIAMLAIVFLPQLSPNTALPGSRGSLMVVVGAIAGVSALVALLTSLEWLEYFGSNIVFVLGWLIGIAGGLLMGWAGWQAFEAEGGQLRLGSAPRDREGQAAPRDEDAASGS